MESEREGIWGSGLVRYEILGTLGLRIGMLETKSGPRGLLGLLDILRSGDLSCPPRGALDFSSVGSLIGPNGETSCVLSHDPNEGGFGGFEGFQGTDVVLMREFRFRGDGLAPGVVIFGNSENEAGDDFPRPGSSVCGLV